MKFIVIGITDNPQPFFPPEVLDIIKRGKVFSGGKRHHEIVAPLLTTDAKWIDITVPLDAVFEQYESLCEEIVVFASGDPLFFGFANTIRRRMPEAEMVVYPSFNSLQMLAHRLLMPYHDMFLRKVQCLECKQADGHLGNHLLAAVEKGERSVRNAVYQLSVWSLFRVQNDAIGHGEILRGGFFE